ncbi:hypothetical protein QFC24_001807 [Naganishia onofrii]|uniref:Uncharacterized protein n=1 Tax=Naganishia onofrii TaxID=1851511 RepID=A0ACC2XRX8_9TREE|nr:hypothetical protein QFC24_001807 [Naganishia onofrii]
MPHKRSKRSVRETEKAKKGQNLAPAQEPPSGYVDDTPKGAARILNSLKVRQDFHEKKKAAATATTDAANKKAKSKQKGGTKDTLPKILPGEKLGDFNRRLEDHMRPVVTQAMKDANAKKADEARKLALEKKERREAQQEAKRKKDASLAQAEKSDGEGEDEEEWAGVDSSSKKPEIAKKASKRTRDPEHEYEDPSNPRKRGKTEFEKAPIRSGILDVMTAPPTLPRLKKSTKQTPSSIFAPINRNPLNSGQQRLMEEERERVVARYRELKETKRLEREEEQKNVKKKKQ